MKTQTADILPFRPKPGTSQALVVSESAPQPQPRVESSMDIGIPSAETLFKIAVGMVIGYVLSELRR